MSAPARVVDGKSAAVSHFGVHVQQVEAFRFTVRFDKEHYSDVTMDEPAPLGADSAPNAARYLAAAVGNCLSASLVFCAKRMHATLDGLETDVEVEIVRNERGRLRIGKMVATLRPRVTADAEWLGPCRALFEDFCMVTQSVRAGFPVEVRIER
jgi:uncharacterized OsmC-like protein